MFLAGDVDVFRFIVFAEPPTPIASRSRFPFQSARASSANKPPFERTRFREEAALKHPKCIHLSVYACAQEANVPRKRMPGSHPTRMHSGKPRTDAVTTINPAHWVSPNWISLPRLRQSRCQRQRQGQLPSLHGHGLASESCQDNLTSAPQFAAAAILAVLLPEPGPAARSGKLATWVALACGNRQTRQHAQSCKASLRSGSTPG